MKFNVRELKAAQADIANIFDWIFKRSAPGAHAWLNAYDAMVSRLHDAADSFAGADENSDLDLDLDVRQALFKTKLGRVYRALFVIENQDVYILRIRGPGQASVSANDLSRL